MRVVVGERAVAAMEGGIEAGDLRQVGRAREQRADRREIVRLVQRRQRDVAFEMREHLVVDQHRPVVVGAAVHDAMADGDRARAFCVSRSQAPAIARAVGTSATRSGA